jgi:hypothetical protein
LKSEPEMRELKAKPNKAILKGIKKILFEIKLALKKENINSHLVFPN